MEASSIETWPVSNKDDELVLGLYHIWLPVKAQKFLHAENEHVREKAMLEASSMPS